MVIKTRVFELYQRQYRNLSETANAMGISVSQVYRVREGKRGINEKFIIGAKKAFPGYTLDDLFYLVSKMPNDKTEDSLIASEYQHMVRKYNDTSLVEA